MAQFHDYVPTGNENVRNFAGVIFTHAFKSFERWGVPSPSGFLEAPLDAYIEALGVFNDPNHGKVDTKLKDDAKKALVKALRVYIQGYIARNPAVTIEDREKMGLPVRDTTLTVHPAPGEKPETDVVPQGRGSHEVTAINPETKGRKKPLSAAGVAFASRVRKLDEAAAKAEDMPSVYQTGASRVFQYSQSMYGLVVDYATAYENGNGKRGPWSNVTSVIISG